MNAPALADLEDARRTATVIPPNVLVNVLGYAARRGIDGGGWFSGLGLTPSHLTDPHVKVSYRQARTILLRALATIDEPGLGLLVGSGERLGSFGVLGLLMMTSATFGDAMRDGIANHEACGSLLDMSFEQLTGGDVALGMWPRFDDPQLQPFLCEEAISSSAIIAGQLLGPGFRLQRVELTYATPPHAALYRSILKCPVRFGARHNRAVIDGRWLTQPLPGASPLVARQALELCQAQLRETRRHRHEIVATVEGLLRDRLDQPPRIGDIATALNLSERSLRRKLAVAGHAFREILDSVRTERALELLRGGAMPVMEVADAVGFSDAREFRRAFKRWTGISPREARTAHG